MVEETVLWFSWRGSPLGSTHLTVAGEPVTNIQLPKLPPANHTMTAPPVDRFVLWGAALRMFRQHPLFGIGPDNFRWIYGNYLGLDHWDTNVHANSIYFEFLADTGLIGFAIFLWLNVRWLWLAVQRVNQQADRQLWVWQLALFASLIAWFVHGLLDYFYEFAGTYILFWIIAGLAITLPTMKAEET
jgi:O-antigen ligase